MKIKNKEKTVREITIKLSGNESRQLLSDLVDCIAAAESYIKLVPHDDTFHIVMVRNLAEKLRNL